MAVTAGFATTSVAFVTISATKVTYLVTTFTRIVTNPAFIRHDIPDAHGNTRKPPLFTPLLTPPLHFFQGHTSFPQEMRSYIENVSGTNTTQTRFLPNPITESFLLSLLSCPAAPPPGSLFSATLSATPTDSRRFPHHFAPPSVIAPAQTPPEHPIASIWSGSCGRISPTLTIKIVY